MGFGSFLKKIIGTVAPVAAAFIPGIGPIASAAIGAAGGALSGGGLKGALLGGVTGGLSGGLGTKLAGAAGLTGASANALSGALIGAGSGAIQGGGLKSALLGGALGGAGGYGLGSLSSGANASGAAMGPSAPTVIDKVGMTLNNGLSGAGNGGLGNLLRTAGTIYSGVQGGAAQDKMKEELLAAQGKAQEAITPYAQSGIEAQSRLSSRLAGGFSAPDLANDAGYQFRLAEGRKALGQAQAASGNYFSGEALKAAQDYGQGLADQTYNDAFSRWNAENGQLANQAGAGLNAATTLAGVYDAQGGINANATLQKSNIRNKTLADLLSGAGALGRQIIGYDENGQPVYANEFEGV